MIDYVSSRLLAQTDGWLDLYQVRIGNSFGLYQALADGGPSTALELSVMTGLREAHLGPWLDRQARAGFLDRSGCKAGIRYRLASEVADALLDSRALEAMFGDDCEGRACRLDLRPRQVETSQVVPSRMALAA
jgi:hypothetical protein